MQRLSGGKRSLDPGSVVLHSRVRPQAAIEAESNEAVEAESRALELDLKVGP